MNKQDILAQADIIDALFQQRRNEYPLWLRERTRFDKKILEAQDRLAYFLDLYEARPAPTDGFSLDCGRTTLHYDGFKVTQESKKTGKVRKVAPCTRNADTSMNAGGHWITPLVGWSLYGEPETTDWSYENVNKNPRDLRPSNIVRRLRGTSHPTVRELTAEKLREIDDCKGTTNQDC